MATSEWLSTANDVLGGIGQTVASLWNAHKSRQSQEKIAQMNLNSNKEFAQNGIQWKVADAKAAGLHPLAALGAQTTSYAPSYGGDSSADTSGIKDAMSAISSKFDKTKKLQDELLQAQVDGQNLANQAQSIANAKAQLAQEPSQATSKAIDNNDATQQNKVMNSSEYWHTNKDGSSTIEVPQDKADKYESLSPPGEVTLLALGNKLSTFEDMYASAVDHPKIAKALKDANKAGKKAVVGYQHAPSAEGGYRYKVFTDLDQMVNEGYNNLSYLKRTKPKSRVDWNRHIYEGVNAIGNKLGIKKHKDFDKTYNKAIKGTF